VSRRPRPTIYESLAQNTDTTVNLVLRSPLPVTTLAPAIRAILRDLDSNIPGIALRTLQERVGLVLALASGRLMAGLLFGIAPTDPVTYALVIVLLLAVAGAAIAVPVRRAVGVSPLIALRTE
jgi:hypothetical protein